MSLQDPPQVARILDSGCNSIEDSISTPIKPSKNDANSFYTSIDMVNALVSRAQNNPSKKPNGLFTGKSAESSSGNVCGKSFNLAQMINQAVMDPNVSNINSIGDSAKAQLKLNYYPKGQIITTGCQNPSAFSFVASNSTSANFGARVSEDKR